MAADEYLCLCEKLNFAYYVKKIQKIKKNLYVHTIKNWQKQLQITICKTRWVHTTLFRSSATAWPFLVILSVISHILCLPMPYLIWCLSLQFNAILYANANGFLCTVPFSNHPTSQSSAVLAAVLMCKTVSSFQSYSSSNYKRVILLSKFNSIQSHSTCRSEYVYIGNPWCFNEI